MKYRHETNKTQTPSSQLKFCGANCLGLPVCVGPHLLDSEYFVKAPGRLSHFHEVAPQPFSLELCQHHYRISPARNYLNSLLLVAGTIILVLLFGVPAGYHSCYDFKG
jgi:ABC-type glycerol-3-phosphate transport system permease component